MSAGRRKPAANCTRRGLVGGAALLALGGALPPVVSQQAAQYQPVPKNGMACEACSFFRPPAACAVVEGRVSPQGWCRLFDLPD